MQIRKYAETIYRTSAFGLITLLNPEPAACKPIRAGREADRRNWHAKLDTVYAGEGRRRRFFFLFLLFHASFCYWICQMVRTCWRTISSISASFNPLYDQIQIAVYSSKRSFSVTTLLLLICGQRFFQISSTFNLYLAQKRALLNSIIYFVLISKPWLHFDFYQPSPIKI
jgi:hypothetical protein